MIAPPLYECVIQTKEKALGIELVNQALKKVEEVIKAKKGNFLKKSEPKVVGEKEESSQNVEQQEIVDSDEENEEGMNIDIQSKSFIRLLF